MLREETVEPATLELLRTLVSLPELKQFRLVGGTALSLLYGHRKSIDIDLFSDQPLEKDVLIEHSKIILATSLLLTTEQKTFTNVLFVMLRLIL